MSRLLRLAIAALSFSFLLYFGSTPRPFGLPVPDMGRLLNPAQGLWQNTKSSLTLRQDRAITLPADIEGKVGFSERGVPHVFTDDVASACYLQGYLTAHDRLWQMDITARATGGYLAEILGDDLLERDRSQIRLGYREAARRAVDSWRRHFPDEYAWVEAYCRGINDYIDQLDPTDYPIEYKLIGYEPRHWSPYHTALIFKSMAQSLSSRYNDLEATYAISQLGAERFAELYPATNPRQSPIISPSTSYDFEPIDSTAGHLPPALPPDGQKIGLLEPRGPEYRHQPPLPHNGSNNWAIAGSRSNTGLPMLANDPHLGLTLPSIWYEIQLSIEQPAIDCRGVSLPGMPLVVIGFNRDVAWGCTNMGHDVTDWYRMDWVDESRRQYRLDGQIREVDLKQDTILTRDGSILVEETPWTAWGPIVDTAVDSRASWLAMHYLAHEAPTDRPHAEFGVFFRLAQARNQKQMADALAAYIDPGQNFVLADRSGTIAMRPSGALPVRAPEHGRFVLDGSRSEQGWSGMVPADQRPAQVNPERGFVASANQRTTAEDYPYYYLGGFDDYRGRYLNRKLAQSKTMNQRDMKQLQQDAFSLEAEELMPLLLARVDHQNMNSEERGLFNQLADWNYQYSPDSRAATFFERWKNRLYQLSFDELPTEDGFARVEQWRWIELLRDQPDHPIFDYLETPIRETAALLTQRAFDEVREEWPSTARAWKLERNTHVAHLGRIPGLGSDRIDSPGAGLTLNAMKSDHGPSWRMVVELGEKPRAWGVIPGGASGHPGSPHYDDGLQEWAAGRYYAISIRSAGDAELAHFWTFSPANS